MEMPTVWETLVIKSNKKDLLIDLCDTCAITTFKPSEGSFGLIIDSDDIKMFDTGSDSPTYLQLIEIITESEGFNEKAFQQSQFIYVL